MADTQTTTDLESIAARPYNYQLHNPQTLSTGQKVMLGTMFAGAAALIAAINLTAPAESALAGYLDKKVQSYGWKVERDEKTGEVHIYWPESDTQPLPLKMTLQNEPAYVLFVESADIVQSALLPEIEKRHRTPYDHRLTPKEVLQFALQEDEENGRHENDVGYITFIEARDMLERLKNGKANLRIDLEGELKRRPYDPEENDRLLRDGEEHTRFLQDRLLTNYRTVIAHERNTAAHTYRQHKAQCR